MTREPATIVAGCASAVGGPHPARAPVEGESWTIRGTRRTKTTWWRRLSSTCPRRRTRAGSRWSTPSCSRRAGSWASTTTTVARWWCGGPRAAGSWPWTTVAPTSGRRSAGRGGRRRGDRLHHPLLALRHRWRGLQAVHARPSRREGPRRRGGDPRRRRPRGSAPAAIEGDRVRDFGPDLSQWETPITAPEASAWRWVGVHRFLEEPWLSKSATASSTPTTGPRSSSARRAAKLARREDRVPGAANGPWRPHAAASPGQQGRRGGHAPADQPPVRRRRPLPAHRQARRARALELEPAVQEPPGEDEVGRRLPGRRSGPEPGPA